MHRTQPRSGTLFMPHMQHFLFLKKVSHCKTKLTFKFVDCQDFELLHTHRWFREKSDVVVCPQSSGESLLFVFLILKSSNTWTLTKCGSLLHSCCSHYSKIVTGPRSWCWTQIIVSRSRFLTAHPHRLWSCCRCPTVFIWVSSPECDAASVWPLTPHD